MNELDELRERLNKLSALYTECELTIHSVLPEHADASHFINTCRAVVSEINGLKAELSDVVEMWLCEVPHLFLRPDQLYRFGVDPNCQACVSAAAVYKKEE